jgi:hypothetical protein
MLKIAGFSVLVLATVAPAYAEMPTLSAFKTAKGALSGKIDAFVANVKACNPPLPRIPGMTSFQDQIINGFAGTDPMSAKNLLNVHEKDVTDHTAAADAAFAQIDKDTAACGAKDGLLARASKTAADVKAQLDDDAANYAKGIQQANAKRAQILAVLGACKTATDKHLPTLGCNVDACSAALDQVTTGKDLDSLNKALTDSLAAIQASYASKVTMETVAINAPNSCQARPAGLFHGVSFAPGETEEIQPIPAAVDHVDGGAETQAI